MSNTPHKFNHLTSFTALRGIFVVFVVLFHCKVQWATDMATSGVVFFFMMSGFLLQRNHGEEPPHSISDRWRFWFKRARRIYPLHWLALALLFTMGILHHVFEPSWKMLPQVFLIQPFIPIRDVFLNYNHASWFLGDLLVCYALFPVMSSLLRRLTWKRAARLLCVSYVIYLIALIPTYSEALITYLHVCPLVRLYEFFAGMVLWQVFQALSEHRNTAPSASQATAIELAAIALFTVFVVFCRLFYSELYNYNDMTWWYIPVAALIFAMAWCASHPGPVSRLLHLRPLVWLGEVSFEIYIFQAVAAFMFNLYVSPVIGHFGFDRIYDYYAWGMWPILLIIAYLTHRFFTPRFDHRVRQNTEKTKKS